MMRIAFLDSWLQQASDGSGTAVAIGGVGRALERRGHTVTRLAPTFARPGPLTTRRLLFNMQLPALLRRLPYDLVVGIDIDGCFWSGHTGGRPYVCSIKGVIAEELQHERGMVRWLLWALSRLERRNARHAPAVLTTSDYCRQAVVRHYGVSAGHIQLVPEGIDLAAWRASSGYERQGHTILCVARQYPRKRVALLLQAFAQVLAAEPRARLVVVGGGPEHTRLQALAAALRLGAACTLTGALPDDAVRACYQQADIFCLPSVQEGFGIVFLEAMASGLPVVAARAAAIPEVVPHTQAGLLVPPDDAAALAAALLTLLHSPEQRAQYAAFGREYVAQFDWDRVAGRFLEAVAPYMR